MEELEAVKHSYGRAALKPAFFDRFYDIFLGSHPSFKPTRIQLARATGGLLPKNT